MIGTTPSRTRSGGPAGAAPATQERPAVPVLVGVGLAIVAVHVIGVWLIDHGHAMLINAPPLTGNLDPRFSPRAWFAFAAGVAGVSALPGIARRWSWRGVLVAVTVAALTWAASLAFADGVAGFTRSAVSGVDYLGAVPLVRSPTAFLHGFVGAIDAYPAHVRAHPPGLVLILWAMGRAGLGGAGWVAALELVAGASSVPAVLIAAREVAGEAVARRAAPFLVLLPAAVFWSSGDAVFLGVSAWAVALLVLATGRRGRSSALLAAAGGAAGGAALFLSYGLVLLAAIPLAVAVRRRRADVAAWATLGAALVVAAFAAVGFSWLGGLAATRREYAESVARVRPYPYFLAANLAAFAIALGPAVWVALARLRGSALRLLVAPALVAVAVADLSGLSKGEVERIWLPFAPWIAVATAAAFAGSTARRRWLVTQVAFALALQLVVASPW